MNENNIKEGRILSILKESVSHFLNEESNGSSFITISYILLKKKKHTALVYCSIFPTENKVKAFAFLKRIERKAYVYIRKNTHLHNIHRIQFEEAKEINFDK